jgi:hypothetical protein
MNEILLLASGVSLVTFVVHWQVGGIYAARPLLAASDITEASRWLNYFCWHIVTVLLLIMTGVLALGAVERISTDAIAVVALIAGSISLLSIAVTLRAGIRPYRFPASYLLASVAALSLAGIL